MILGQDLDKIANVYDTVAKEYTEAFSGGHEKKPKDREILKRFSQEIGDRRPVWDFGCGPGHTAKYLKDLGVEISGLDLSEKYWNRQRLFTRIYTSEREIFSSSNSKTTR
jgi:predicted TPR repeat methyltransferase